MPGSDPNSEVKLHAAASKERLSLKAKGAGLFILLALVIIGVSLIGYRMVGSSSSSSGILPLMLLMGIGYQLITILASTFGLERTNDD